jgi:hypothetical protein
MPRIQGEQELQLEQQQVEIDYEHFLHHQVTNMLKDIIQILKINLLMQKNIYSVQSFFILLIGAK